MTPLMVAAYRPHIDPTILRVLAHMFWLPFLAAWWPYSVQLCVIGAVALRRVGSNPFPRWYGWMCFVLAILVWTPTIFFGLEKSGPFAWSGVYFWCMAVSAFSYYLATVVVLRRALLQEAMDAKGAAPFANERSGLDERTPAAAIADD